MTRQAALGGTFVPRPDPLRQAAAEPRVLYQRLTAMITSLDDPVLQAIRVELYFHVLSVRSWGRWHWARDRVYPAWARARSMQARKRLTGMDIVQESRPARTLVVVENETAAGLGTLMPLLSHPGLEDVTVAATDRVVLALRDSGPREPRRLWTRMSDREAGAEDRPTVHERYECLLGQAGKYALREELETMSGTVRALIGRAAAYHAGLAKYFDRNRCLRQVVTHNDFMPSTYLALALARERGMREMTLQHGMPVLEYAPISTGRYLIWGEWAHHWFRARGAAPSTLTVTGCPRMDPFFCKSARSAPRVDQPRLLVLSQTHSPILEPDQHSAIVGLLGDGIQALGPNWTISVRLHPLETKRLYRAIWPRALFDRVVFVNKTQALKDVIQDATVLVGVQSTAMIEGMILWRPIVQINTMGTGAEGYSSALLDIVVSTGQELSDCVGRLVADQSFRDYVLRSQDAVLDRLFAQRGCATEAVLGYLLSASA